MSLIISNKTLDKYFGFLWKLDDTSKRKIIDKLTKSLKSKEKSSGKTSLYGAWEDERSADEIIKEIIESRINKADFKSF